MLTNKGQGALSPWPFYRGHIVHFTFTADQIEKFQVPGTQVILGLTHPNYGHMALLLEAARAELAGDFAANP